MLVSFARTFFLYILVVIAIRLMGKKQVGQLEPVEFVIILLLSELASIPMQDMNLPLMHSVVPIISLVGLEILISLITLKLKCLRDAFQGKPVILIHQGVMDIQKMKSTRVNIDEVMEEIRQAGYADIRDVEYAILENSGMVSIIPAARNKPVTVDDLKLKTKPGAYPFVVINDGKVVEESLQLAGLTRQQLESHLTENKIPNVKNVFYAVLDSNGEFYFQLKEGA